MSCQECSLCMQCSIAPSITYELASIDGVILTFSHYLLCWTELTRLVLLCYQALLEWAGLGSSWVARTDLHGAPHAALIHLMMEPFVAAGHSYGTGASFPFAMVGLGPSWVTKSSRMLDWLLMSTEFITGRQAWGHPG